MRKITFAILLFLTNLCFSKPKVGITLLPYYSYVKNIVKDKMDVIPLVPENADVHSYSASSNDIKKLIDLDYIVVNGIGHDEFVIPMINATKKNNKKLKIIYANTDTTLLNTAGQKKSNLKNPHTFISINQAIEQVNYISKKLGEYDSKNKDFYKKNAIEYTKKLRNIKKNVLKKVENLFIPNIKIATTHAGYDYLLNEFGLTVELVIEPAHGQNPNASDLKDAISKINSKNVLILFDEYGGNHKNAQIIAKETGIEVAYLSHLTSGKYSADSFEKFIEYNLENVANALIKISKGKK